VQISTHIQQVIDRVSPQFRSRLNFGITKDGGGLLLREIYFSEIIKNLYSDYANELALTSIEAAVTIANRSGLAPESIYSLLNNLFTEVSDPDSVYRSFVQHANAIDFKNSQHHFAVDYLNQCAAIATLALFNYSRSGLAVELSSLTCDRISELRASYDSFVSSASRSTDSNLLDNANQVRDRISHNFDTLRYVRDAVAFGISQVDPSVNLDTIFCYSKEYLDFLIEAAKVRWNISSLGVALLSRDVRSMMSGKEAKIEDGLPFPDAWQLNKAKDETELITYVIDNLSDIVDDRILVMLLEKID
jgi:Uri superfamily endonuclease